MAMYKEPSDATEAIIEVRPLREQVYEYLRREMQMGGLLPGAYIKLKEIGEKLGVSKTPLRDAIIHLECEGFVEILPRRGVRVAKLSVDDIRNILQIVGALESSVILSVCHRLGPDQISHMRRLNSDMIAAIGKEDFDSYYKLNIRFHDVFLRLSENRICRGILMPLKQRLYDFPRRSYIQEWELINCQEHDQFIEYVRQGDGPRAAALLRDSHWSFDAYEKFIRQFYFGSEKRIASELAWRK